jgi:hypothetical protein
MNKTRFYQYNRFLAIFGEEMRYTILVVNQQPLGAISAKALRLALMGVHFSKLCDQYQLDHRLIESVTSNLDVVVSKSDYCPFFYVRYGPAQDQLLFIYEWLVNTEKGKSIQQRLLGTHPEKAIKEGLLKARAMVEIELTQQQLTDMGLLLAYELARWAGSLGEGRVLSLEGKWYRLNVHRAFMPVYEIL